MEGLLTAKELFDEHFKGRDRQKKPIEFYEVIQYAASVGLLKESVEAFITKYQNAMQDLTLMGVDFQDDELDIDDQAKIAMGVLLLNLNQYFNESESIYEAIQDFIENDPFSVLCRIQKVLAKRKNALQMQLDSIYKNAMHIYNHHGGSHNLYRELKNNINGKLSHLSYRFMDGKLGTNPYFFLDDGSRTQSIPLGEIEKILKALDLEYSILNKFKEEELLSVLSCITDSQDNNNLCELVLYNYVFNALYKEEPTILFSTNMAKIINRDIEKGMITSDEIIEIINQGKIMFTGEEKEYILQFFIPVFKSNVEKLKLKDVYIITDYENLF